MAHRLPCRTERIDSGVRPQPVSASSKTSWKRVSKQEDSLSKRKLVLFLMTLPGITTVAISQQVPIRWESAGKASSYGWERQGKLTSSGEVFDYHKLTAAHRTLPFGSIVLVTNTHNGKQVKVRINDRGPGYPRRIIDVSTAAARRLGFDGLTDATIAVLYYGPVTPDYYYLALHCQAGQGERSHAGSISRGISISKALGRSQTGSDRNIRIAVLQEDLSQNLSFAVRVHAQGGIELRRSCPKMFLRWPLEPLNFRGGRDGQILSGRLRRDSLANWSRLVSARVEAGLRCCDVLPKNLPL
jgi:rare lipoprotein A (peptidoglycan hydrolase)